MNGFLMKAGLGTAMAATALAAAAPAEAQRWRGRGYDRGGDVAAGALIGGVIGLGLGAAIASNNNRGPYRGGYGYNGYDGYARRGWGPQPYYHDYRYNYRPRCFRQWRYDPYYGRVPVRVCR